MKNNIPKKTINTKFRMSLVIKYIKKTGEQVNCSPVHNWKVT